MAAAAQASGTSGRPESGKADWYRVLELAVGGLGGSAEADYAAILPAALNAARSRRSFIAGWLSRGAGQPLELITNAGPLPAAPPPAGPLPAAPPLTADAGPEAVDLLFPWGARGIALAGNMLAEFDRLVWAPCPGRPTAPQAGAGRAMGGERLFDAALQALTGRPFGWLIVADPTDAIDAEITELRDQFAMLRRYEDEQARLEAARVLRRLADLDDHCEAGLWDVRVLAGAATEEDLQLIAPVLAGAVDLSGHAYRLRSPAGAQEFADALSARHADPADGCAVPFAATAGVLTALTGLPGRDVPGVRVTGASAFGASAFGASGMPTAGGPAVTLGSVLDRRGRPVGDFEIPLTTLNRHVLVTGAAATGKSRTVRHMLGQLAGAGIGWLAVEAVRPEYARAGSGRGPVLLINPADPDSVPVTVSPLAPEPGYPVRAHIDMVRALFLAAAPAGEPYGQVIGQALQLVYEECGWDPLTGAGRADSQAPPAVPTLARLHSAAQRLIEDIGYGRELRAELRGRIDALFGSLLTGPAGRFLEGGHPADIGALLERDVVIRLGDITGDEDKAFVTGALIIRLAEHLRLQSKIAPDGQGEHGRAGRSRADGALSHVLVLEEPHRLLRAARKDSGGPGSDGAAERAVDLFAGLLAELRAYGEGVVLVEPAPARLAPDAVSGTAVKVVHRLPDPADRGLVGATMNMDEQQSRHVVSLPPGEAAVFTDGMDSPVRIRVPLAGAVPDVAAAPAAELEAALLPVLHGRRSAACGQLCTSVRPCTLVEIRAADLLGRAPQDAWLRVWSEVYVLAHLVNRPRPRVPVPLREHWSGMDQRLRECLLGFALEAAVRRRDQVLRRSYDPAELTAACAGSAAAVLDGGKGAGTMPGTRWVIPQLQWLHELERLCPVDGPAPDPFARAPGLDYALPGLAEGADAKIGQRVSALRRHALSMEVATNRVIAWTALLGDDDSQAFIEDLAAVAIGISHRGQLGKAAGEMGVTGWLDAVLSWPRRLIVGADEQAAGHQAAGHQAAGHQAGGQQAGGQQAGGQQAGGQQAGGQRAPDRHMNDRQTPGRATGPQQGREASRAAR